MAPLTVDVLPNISLLLDVSTLRTALLELFCTWKAVVESVVGLTSTPVSEVPPGVKLILLAPVEVRLNDVPAVRLIVLPAWMLVAPLVEARLSVVPAVKLALLADWAVMAPPEAPPRFSAPVAVVVPMLMVPLAAAWMLIAEEVLPP